MLCFSMPSTSARGLPDAKAKDREAARRRSVGRQKTMAPQIEGLTLPCSSSSQGGTKWAFFLERTGRGEHKAEEQTADRPTNRPANATHPSLLRSNARRFIFILVRGSGGGGKRRLTASWSRVARRRSSGAA